MAEWLVLRPDEAGNMWLIIWSVLIGLGIKNILQS